MAVWLDDDEYFTATSMKEKDGIPVTQAFRAFVINKLIPTTETTLMQREVLDNMADEFKAIAACNQSTHEQYARIVIAYANVIINMARSF